LGIDRKALDKRIASGKTQSVKVPGNTRVHLYYFTAWPDETGKIQYYQDSYGRDAALTKARGLMFKLAGGTVGQKIVVNQAADVKIRTETQQ
jgi:murein L,D-transpeptidase YcbB/YkuD